MQAVDRCSCGGTRIRELGINFASQLSSKRWSRDFFFLFFFPFFFLIRDYETRFAISCTLALRSVTGVLESVRISKKTTKKKIATNEKKREIVNSEYIAAIAMLSFEFEEILQRESTRSCDRTNHGQSFTSLAYPRYSNITGQTSERLSDRFTKTFSKGS